jgi:hypothetical protein
MYSFFHQIRRSGVVIICVALMGNATLAIDVAYAKPERCRVISEDGSVTDTCNGSDVCSSRTTYKITGQGLAGDRATLLCGGSIVSSCLIPAGKKSLYDIRNA